MTIIIFDGPDKTGKSTSATNLHHDRNPIYNATKESYQKVVELNRETPELPFTFDRLDWFTHMVYRLGMPGYEWNDDRIRTVFAAPEAHLVVKVHETAAKISDELYSQGELVTTNTIYRRFAHFLADMNSSLGFTWFKSVTIIDIIHDQKTGLFTQRFNRLSSPVFTLNPFNSPQATDETLLNYLRHIDETTL